MRLAILAWANLVVAGLILVEIARVLAQKESWYVTLLLTVLLVLNTGHFIHWFFNLGTDDA